MPNVEPTFTKRRQNNVYTSCLSSYFHISTFKHAILKTIYDLVVLVQVGLDGATVDSEPVILPVSSGGKNMLHVKLEDEGCFHAVVTCHGKSITNGVFDIVSLNRKCLYPVSFRDR